MIYICIPAHNEQQTVGVVLWKLRQVFAEYPRDYQLLVAEDASTDKTADVLEPYTRVLPLTVFRTPRRLGQAACLEMLLREAVRRSEYPKRDVIVTLQADFSEEPDDLIALIKRMEAGADVAVGNKIADSKPSRTRRFSRALAGFFMRRQKWPESVATPFDGYRAYRLYAVRRAIEERAGERLIRYDGWAGSAELLRAVLPHARRVDAVDISDRTDRLQRDRRERPFDAAMQVRAMSRGVAPAGTPTVAELDNIATTASHSRERTTLATMQQDRAAQRGAAEREGRRGGSGNGRRERAPRRDGERSGRRDGAAAERGPRGERGGRDGEAGQERRPRRERSGEGSGAARERPARGTRTRERRPATEAEAGGDTGVEAAEGSGRPARKRPPRRKRSERADGAGAAAPENAADTADTVLPAAAVDDAASAEGGEQGGEEERAPKKRRRRRRRRSSSGAGGAEQASAGAEGSSEDGGDEGGDAASESGDDGINGEDGGTGERKRRRRGGRRGGRGRRRRRPDGDEASAENGSADGDAPGEPRPERRPTEDGPPDA